MCDNPAVPILKAVSPAGDTVYFYRPNCGLWTCEDCGENKRRYWVARIGHGVEMYQAAGEDFTFATITSHEQLKTFDATLQVWPKAWSKLYDRMKYKYGSVRYVLLPEKHADGRLHVHMIGTLPADERWMKDTPRKCGLGYMNDIEPIRDVAKACWYVSKYISKSLDVIQWPKNMRRVRTSHKWPELPENGAGGRLELDFFRPAGDNSLWYLVLNERRNGKNVINLNTGEFFPAGVEE